MDKRFLIYEGFENEVGVIFGDMLEKYNFDIKNKSDSGVFFENARVVVDLSYETVPIVWITNKIEGRDRLLNHIVRESKIELKEELKSILGEDFYKDRKGSLKRLSQFLVEHLSDELSEQ